MAARWLPCLLLVACGDGLLQVPPPPWPTHDARSYVVFFSGSEGTEIKGAGAKEPSDQVVNFGATVDGEGRDALAISIAWYPQSLVELELLEGPVEEKARPCEIEHPSTVLRYEDAREPGREWSSPSELNEVEKARLRSNKCGRFLCDTFASKDFILQEGELRSTQLLLSASNGDVVAGVEDLAYLVDVDGAVPLPLPVPSLPTRSGFIHGGELWLAGSGRPGLEGLMVHGTFTRGFDGTVTSTLVPEVEGLLEAISRAPGESLMLVGASGPKKEQDVPMKLHVFDGRAWRAQTIDSGYRQNTTVRLGVVWVDENTAVIVTGGRPLRFDRATESTRPLWPRSFANINAVAYLEGQGFLAGGEVGEAYFAASLDDDELEEVIPPDNSSVEAVITYEDGFLIGNSAGKVQQYIRGGLSCPAFYPVAIEIEQMVQNSDGLVVLGGNNRVAWLTPQAPAGR